MQLPKKLIIANWKANKSPSEAQTWITEFSQQERRDSYEYVLCPPYPALTVLHENRGDQDSLFSLGVQDLSGFGAGAYTGEIAPANLVGLDVRYALLGHSERRRHLHETSQQVAQKVEIALDSSITPVVCIDRDQIEEQAAALPNQLLSQLVIAYEPVHAISTFGGQEDPLETTLEVIRSIREVFGDVPVLYGGSVDPENSLVYLGQDEIDGVLVGGASLQAKTFAAL